MTTSGAGAPVRWHAACMSVAVSLLLSACGYPGDTRPPALNRPLSVRDLAAVERGDKILLHFSVPKRTTEDLPVKGAPELELRIGPLPEGRFDVAQWERVAERVPDSAIQVKGDVASAEISASKYYGKTEVIGVRALGPSGRNVGWSNFEVLSIVQPLATPAGLEAKDAPDAVRLEWHGAAPEYRVYRKLSGESGAPDGELSLVGTSNKPFFVDSGIEFGKTYKYFVQAVEKAGEKYAESDVSDQFSFRPVDRFAPAVPAGVTAVPGTRTIELVWERNAEKDFASYRVYRDGQKVAEGLTAPAYSDKDVKPGVRYRYEVSALDTAGNESTRSAAIETSIP